MKLSPSIFRFLSLFYLPFICAFSYFASYWLNHAIREYGERTVNIPFFGLSYVGEWLPLGTALLFIAGFVPFVFATFVHRNFIFISPAILGVLLICFVLFKNNEMGKQIIMALSTSQMFGLMVGFFVQLFKPIVPNKQ